MRFNRRDVWVGLAIVLVVIIVGLLIRRSRNKNADTTPTPISTNSIKQEIQDKLKYQIPTNTESIELKDVSGGDSRGIATEKEILVDAPNPETGNFYQGWLENNGNLVSLGKLQIAKGGWLINFDGTKYPDHKKVIVSQEKELDNTLEKKILEGSF